MVKPKYNDAFGYIAFYLRFPLTIVLLSLILAAAGCNNTPQKAGSESQPQDLPDSSNTMNKESVADESQMADDTHVDPLAVKPDASHHQDDNSQPVNPDIPAISDNIRQSATDNDEQPVASNRLSPKIYKYPKDYGDFGGFKCETTLKYHEQSVYVSKKFKRNNEYTNEEAIDLLLQKGCKRVCDEILKNNSEDCITDCSENASFDSPIQCYITKLEPGNML